MGFPLDRVSRVAERIGKDDKKVNPFYLVIAKEANFKWNSTFSFQIVEHLIPLSELLDLGFDESKISDALIQFDNNKEKALDFLIS